ncbi:uncharacterized protein LODBEIA_P19510 [Lodderomyces beijingensis]|uniref:Uncharacterized protein n=1 Tax=Lodderomyces beijingensis TaxID=1775926 RepID=A0ABP0ZNG7_9ASCO
MANQQYTYSNYLQYSPNMGQTNTNSINLGSASNNNNNNNSAQSNNHVSASNNNNNNNTNNNINNTSPLNNLSYLTPPGTSSNTASLSSSLSSTTSSMFGPTLSNTLAGSSSSSYSFHTPRLRYYLSKSFDIEDDLEFCPEIPTDHLHGYGHGIPGGHGGSLFGVGGNNSPSLKKFNPYTATVFSPSHEISQQQQQQQQLQSQLQSQQQLHSQSRQAQQQQQQPQLSKQQSPRVVTPRIRKPLEIINPHTKMRVGSPATKSES